MQYTYLTKILKLINEQIEIQRAEARKCNLYTPKMEMQLAEIADVLQYLGLAQSK